MRHCVHRVLPKRLYAACSLIGPLLSPPQEARIHLAVNLFFRAWAEISLFVWCHGLAIDCSRRPSHPISLRLGCRRWPVAMCFRLGALWQVEAYRVRASWVCSRPTSCVVAQGVEPVGSEPVTRAPAGGVRASSRRASGSRRHGTACSAQRFLGHTHCRDATCAVDCQIHAHRRDW